MIPGKVEFYLLMIENPKLQNYKLLNIYKQIVKLFFSFLVQFMAGYQREASRATFSKLGSMEHNCPLRVY